MFVILWFYTLHHKVNDIKVIQKIQIGVAKNGGIFEKNPKIFKEKSYAWREKSCGQVLHVQEDNSSSFLTNL